MLSSEHKTLGFDTGPGNALLDAWCLENLSLPFDDNGSWAAQGKIIPGLLDQLMSEPYFKKPYPKSTGKEFFNIPWLRSYTDESMSPVDIQATLLEVTALSIAEGINLAAASTKADIHEVYVCGGGAKNLTLMRRLEQVLRPAALSKTDALGVDADWVEAIAFAWLARQTLLGLPGNLPSATGASGDRILGCIYPA